MNRSVHWLDRCLLVCVLLLTACAAPAAPSSGSTAVPTAATAPAAAPTAAPTVVPAPTAAPAAATAPAEQPTATQPIIRVGVPDMIYPNGATGLIDDQFLAMLSDAAKGNGAGLEVAVPCFLPADQIAAGTGQGACAEQEKRWQQRFAQFKIFIPNKDTKFWTIADPMRAGRGCHGYDPGSLEEFGIDLYLADSQCYAHLPKLAEKILPITERSMLVVARADKLEAIGQDPKVMANWTWPQMIDMFKELGAAGDLVTLPTDGSLFVPFCQSFLGAKCTEDYMLLGKPMADPPVPLISGVTDLFALSNVALDSDVGRPAPLLADGKAAVAVTWSDALPELASIKGLEFGLLPPGGDSKENGTARMDLGWAVPDTSHDTGLASKVANSFAANKDLGNWAISRGMVPSASPVPPDANGAAYYQAAKALGEKSKPWQIPAAVPIPQYNSFMQVADASVQIWNKLAKAGLKDEIMKALQALQDARPAPQ